MNKLILILSLLISVQALSADHHKEDKGDKRIKIWQAKLKIDLAELKGPPSVADFEQNKADKLADLNLLINSGKYDDGQLKRLKAMQEKLMEREIPTQEVLNNRHERRIKMAKRKMHSHTEMLKRQHRHEGRKRERQDKNEWEKRKNRHRR